MSGTLVSLRNGSTDEGAEISGFDYSGGNHQKWQLQFAGYSQNMTLRNVQTNTYLWFRGQSFVPSFSVKSSRQSQEYNIIPTNRGF
ncbi:ricin-type beta-trefoil lectin domain protein [Rhizoctonia solani AG-3 Rhs1AP]|nr:ricin-type beta-trefoil lectin domain protein [Rhizoctonia solani AG-3 Rhs1AP]